MSQVSTTSAHAGARRRSQRVLMQVGIRVRGKDAQGKDFEEMTETLAVNACRRASSTGSAASRSSTSMCA